MNLEANSDSIQLDHIDHLVCVEILGEPRYPTLLILPAMKFETIKKKYPKAAGVPMYAHLDISTSILRVYPAAITKFEVSVLGYRLVRQ